MDTTQGTASGKVNKISTVIEVGHEPSIRSQDSSDVSDAPKNETYLQAIRAHPRAFMWCMYIVWVMLSSNYINTAGGSVLGIPRFRKDFGSPYKGDYVLPAAWQSAYFGAPSAA